MTSLLFLLQRGVDVNTQFEGFHWAAFGGYLDIVLLFLERKLPLEVRNRWDGTVLSAAVYGAEGNGRRFRRRTAAPAPRQVPGDGPQPLSSRLFAGKQKSRFPRTHVRPRTIASPSLSFTTKGNGWLASLKICSLWRAPTPGSIRLSDRTCIWMKLWANAFAR